MGEDARGPGQERAAAPVEHYAANGLLEELERHLCALIGLREHRGAGLRQNIPAGKLGGFLRDIDVDDTARGSFQVGLVDRNQLVRKAEAALFRTVVGAHGRHVRDGRGDIGHRDRCQGGRAGDETDASGAAREIARGDRHRRATAFSDADVANGSGSEQVDPVELFSPLCPLS